ncbi:hypothetical protein P775_16590 [Puniceibacterium antarcticum]|uniref:Uncharacterized protein n=1 Tax=Puniceibacterium antarcticum TaxID=1206336 RepID=A0A2G8RBZ9_9RHOB|nr:hypothetical protein P775_16590 [Puniceibacterium antarcticum]
MREYPDTLDEEAFGAATPVKPKFTAHANPASQWMAARKGPAFFAYSGNYLIDTDHVVIVDVEVTRSVQQAEVGSTLTMLDRSAERERSYWRLPTHPMGPRRAWSSSS